MRLARVGSIRLALAVGTVIALGAPGAAPAAAQSTPGAGPAAAQSTPGAGPAAAAKPSFKVTISPEYTTAGAQTAFKLTVVNTSAGTTLGSVAITPPRGFTSPRPTPGSPLRGKTKVRQGTLSLRQLSLKRGNQTHLAFTAIAPTKCGRTLLHWTSQAFQSTDGSGPQLALNAALSSLGVTVLCPAAAVCGDGGPACSTSLVTSESTYAVISDAASGTLNQTVNVGRPLHCGAYRFRDPNWYDSVVSPPSASPPTTPTAPIVDDVTYKIRNATKNGIGFCLGAAYDFATRSGAQARAGTLPNGKPGFIGLLPLCTSAKPPCITSITQQRDPKAKTGYDALMKIQIPESGDPWGGG